MLPQTPNLYWQDIGLFRVKIILKRSRDLINMIYRVLNVENLTARSTQVKYLAARRILAVVNLVLYKE